MLSIYTFYSSFCHNVFMTFIITFIVKKNVNNNNNSNNIYTLLLHKIQITHAKYKNLLGLYSVS